MTAAEDYIEDVESFAVYIRRQLSALSDTVEVVHIADLTHEVKVEATETVVLEQIKGHLRFIATVLDRSEGTSNASGN